MTRFDLNVKSQGVKREKSGAPTSLADREPWLTPFSTVSLNIVPNSLFRHPRGAGVQRFSDYVWIPAFAE